RFVCDRTNFFFFSRSYAHRLLPPFPTRRSSDLNNSAPGPAVGFGLSARLSGRCDRTLRSAPITRFGSGRALCPAVGFERAIGSRSEEHTSELQSRENLVCRLLLEKKKQTNRPGK